MIKIKIKIKIINQLHAGGHIAAVAEAMAMALALALGLREGVDADTLFEVIPHSAGNSWMFEHRVAHVLTVAAAHGLGHQFIGASAWCAAATSTVSIAGCFKQAPAGCPRCNASRPASRPSCRRCVPPSARLEAAARSRDGSTE